MSQGAVSLHVKLSGPGSQEAICLNRRSAPNTSTKDPGATAEAKEGEYNAYGIAVDRREGLQQSTTFTSFCSYSPRSWSNSSSGGVAVPSTPQVPTGGD